MARYFTADQAVNAAAPVTAAPLSMACWFKADNVTAEHSLMSVFDASDRDKFLLIARGNATGDPVSAWTEAGSARIADTTTGYSAGVWQHAAAVFAADDDRRAFLNGGNKGTETTSRTPAGLDQVAIGADPVATSPEDPADAVIAEAAIWNVALSDAEVAALATVNPLKIRPDKIVAYWPLYGRQSPEPDYFGTYPLTLTGTASADHPPVPFPQWGKRGFGLIAPAAGGDSENVSPLAFTLGIPAPTITHGQPVDPLAFALAQPAVSIDGTIDVSPIAFSLGLPTPTVEHGQAVDPLTFALTLPDVVIDGTIAVSPLTFELGIPTPATKHDEAVDPLDFGLTLPTPTTDHGETVSPLAFGLNLPAITTLHDETVSPLVFTFSLGTFGDEVAVDPLAFELGLGQVVIGSTVTITTMRRTAGGTVYIAWETPQDPPYYVYRDGELIDTTYAKSYTIHAAYGEYPNIEVLPAGETAQELNAARFRITFDAVAGAAEYRIDRKISSVWTEVATINDDGSSAYVYRTEPLSDGDTHEFRVVPINAAGNEGTATEISRKLIRTPDPLNLSYAYDSGTAKVTISEA